MDTTRKPISIAEAISAAPAETGEDVLAWQMRKIRERQQAADQGRFASSETVKAVIRKFIPENG